MGHPFDTDLDKNPANYTPSSPLSFRRRTAKVFPDRTAVLHGDIRYGWAEFYARSRRLASALAKRGIGVNDCVAVIAPNIPQMLEAHFGIPMAGGVINALNYRLDAKAIAFSLDHGEAKVLLADTEFAPVVREALSLATATPLVIASEDPEGLGGGRPGWTGTDAIRPPGRAPQGGE